MKSYRVFVVNPGSTSTKVALFEGEQTLFEANVSHDAAELAKFVQVKDQLPYRIQTIEQALAEKGIALEHIDACVGRGGGLLPMAGGTYKETPLLLEHSISGANGVQHPAMLGISIAKHFADKLGCPVFTVNPPDVDEYIPEARITGIKGVYRKSHLHALNLKETAIRHAASIGKRYEDCNFVVCHIGGGVSVSAHRRGCMIDGHDIAGGEGPIAPTRCGTIPVSELLQVLEKSGQSCKELRQICTKTGGLVSHLGTSDGREVRRRIAEGDGYAKLVWDAMLYQIAKYIGSMAVALQGQVDAILLGGGLVHDQGVVDYIRENCGFLAPVVAYPGEFELEAMAQGAIRVISGQEEAKEYTAEPVWDIDDVTK